MRVRNDGKFLLPGPIGSAAAEEGLKLLEGRLHGDDTVGAALALKASHCRGELVLGLYLAAVEKGLQMRDGEVAQESAGLRIDDSEVCVVALEGGQEGERDGVGGVERERGRRVEVFDSGLNEGRRDKKSA